MMTAVTKSIITLIKMTTTIWKRAKNVTTMVIKRARHDNDTAPCPTFDAMNLKPDLLKGIYAYGFEKPSAIQQRAIHPIIRGRDVIAQSQSGTGKTAVFSIAALQILEETKRETQVLVLSPTRELAEQSQRVKFGRLSQYQMPCLYWRKVTWIRSQRIGAWKCSSSEWNTRSCL